MFAVLEDASERFAPDPDRIILSGGSMGGIGAFRLGALYPDRFSVNAPLIGLATEDTRPLLGNLWNLPVRQINGAQDPLIPADGATFTTDGMDELELAYRAWMLDQRGHEAGGFVYDCVFASLPEFERVTAPAQVRYAVDPAQFVSDPDSGLELSYDGAYWVSGMVVADVSDLGSVVAHSAALDSGTFDAVHIDRQGGSGPDGGDLCGDNPDVITEDTWHERAVERVAPAGLVVAEPVLTLELDNLTAITVDVATAGLTDEGTIEVNADQPVEVTLTGVAPGTVVTGGDEDGEAEDDGTLSVTVPEGETTLTS